MLKFTDVCFITDNVQALASFYEKLFDVKAEGDETHSIIVLPKFGIAIYSKTAAMNDHPELDCTDYINDRFYIGFNCDDAATEYERIKSLGICTTPTKPIFWP